MSKKAKNKATKNRIATKKGKKKVARKKVAKSHLEIKRETVEARKRKEEKLWEEHYNSLLGNS